MGRRLDASREAKRIKKARIKAIIFYGLFISMLITIFTFSKYSTEIYGQDIARVALFGNSTSIELENIKAKPGDIKIIPIEITNSLDGKACEISEVFTIYVDRKYSNNLPINMDLFKDAQCSEKIYTNESKIYQDDSFMFQAGKKERKKYYLKIEWPDEYKQINNAFEIDYISIFFRVTQVD